MKYYLIGPYPPPFGGVSVYEYRLSKLLSKQGHDVKIIDFYKYHVPKKILFLLFIIFNPEKAFFYINSIHISVMVALILRIFPGTILFFDHSGHEIESMPGIKRFIFSHFLGIVDECILVGEHLVKYYEVKGFKLPHNTHVQHSFLPPPEEDEHFIWKSYTDETCNFIKNHYPLIVANAFRISFYQGVDLYGIDMCTELVSKLKNKYPNIGLLFALAEVGNIEYFDIINTRIQEFGIRDNFYFLTGQKELWPIFKRAQLMIRPTFIDGFGISISEALYFGCSVVASDVCKRAEGTIIFKNRNIDDLLNKVESVLNGKLN